MLFSPYIVACRPAPNKDAYVHVFQMNAELLKNNKAYACYVNLVNAKGSFGIITDRALPITTLLPQTNVGFGLINTIFKTNALKLRLSEIQIRKIGQFHASLFKDVLNCLLPFIVTDNSNSDESYYIVPLIEDETNMQIAWSIVNNPLVTEIHGSNRIVKYDNVENNVTTHWPDYDPDKSQNYLIHKLIPPKQRDTSNGEMYASDAFYTMEVFPMPNLPQSEINDTNHNDIDPTVMICVSCVQHRLSGSYWIKATILPVILVSMNHSLTTIYLKDRLASEAFSGRTTVYPNPTTCYRNMSHEKITFDVPELPTLSRNSLAEPNYEELLTVLLPNDSKYTNRFENLKLLGQSFQKFVIAFYMFEKYETLSDLSIAVMNAISNKRLEECDRTVLKLGSRLQMYKVVPKFNWCPPGFRVPPELIRMIEESEKPYAILSLCTIPPDDVISGILSEQTKNRLRDIIQQSDVSKLENPQENYQFSSSTRRQVHKTTVTSNCVSALVGSYLLAGGINRTTELLKYLGIIQTDFNVFELKNNRNGRARYNIFWNTIKQLEENIGYKFNDKRLLYEALSHTCQKAGVNYEKLEFIGDALIEFLLTIYLCEYQSDKDKKDMYIVKTSLCNNIQLAYKSIHLELHKYMLCDCHLQTQIEMFVNIHGRNTERYKPIYTKNTATLKVAVARTVPKSLGDIFESLMAAIYLDSGKSLNTLWIIMYNIMRKEIVELSRNLSVDPKRGLYEKFAGNLPLRIYIENDRTIAEVQVKREDRIVTYRGISTNHMTAKQTVATMIMQDDKE